MKTALISIMLLATTSIFARAEQATTHKLNSVAVTVSGAEVRATVTENGGDVTLSIGGKGSVQVGLPESESVSEIRIGRYMSVGIALAIETRNKETDEFGYYWCVAWVNVPTTQIGRPVLGSFLKSKIDYDVVGVVNSQSDSIYLTLMRHQRGGESESLDGYVYVNNCPVSPEAKGSLFPLEVHAKVPEPEQ